MARSGKNLKHTRRGRKRGSETGGNGLRVHLEALEPRMLMDAGVLGAATGLGIEDLAVLDPEAKPVADWTYMAYLCGDCNLERSLVSALDKLEAGAGHANVNIVVQLDRHAAEANQTWEEYTGHGDWSDARRFLVQYDGNEGSFHAYEPGETMWYVGPDGAQVDPVADPDFDADMSFGDTLSDFVSWATDLCPARHYALNINGHGSAWAGMALDNGAGSPRLTLSGLAGTLRHADTHLDVLHLDSCNMAMVEVATEVAEFCDYVVFCESESYPDLSPYGQYVAAAASSDNGRDLAVAITRAYAQATQLSMWLPTGQVQYTAPHTICAVRTAGLPQLHSALDEFADAMRVDLPLESYRVARDAAIKVSGSACYDLYSFAEQVQLVSDSQAVDAAAQRVMDGLTDGTVIVPGSLHTQSGMDDRHGIGICAPDIDTFAEYTVYTGYRFESLRFKTDHRWDEFLGNYFSKPWASVVEHDFTIITHTHSAWHFCVEYGGHKPIDVSTLGDRDIVVIGPNRMRHRATLVSVEVEEGPLPMNQTPEVRAHYCIAAPGGTWDANDSGTYQIWLRSDEVSNTDGNSASSKLLESVTLMVGWPRQRFGGQMVVTRKGIHLRTPRPIVEHLPPQPWGPRRAHRAEPRPAPLYSRSVRADAIPGRFRVGTSRISVARDQAYVGRQRVGERSARPSAKREHTRQADAAMRSLNAQQLVVDLRASVLSQNLLKSQRQARREPARVHAHPVHNAHMARAARGARVSAAARGLFRALSA